MKRTLSIITLIIIICTTAFAQRVSEQEAQLVCRNFILENGKSELVENVRLAETYTQNSGEVALYRYSLGEKGFVVVSASLTTPPVLAYSFDNEFEMIPPVRDLFYLYKGEIAEAEKSGWDAKPQAQTQWKRLMSENFEPELLRATGKGPLLTTTWDQGKYYNTYCPWDVQAGSYYDYRVPNGCVANACAQIMNYHRYPESGIGVTTYVPQGYPRQTIYFYQHKYNYDAMCNAPTTYANEIAKLAYHFGVAIQMNYNYDGSGAQTTQAKNKLASVFNYDQSITSYYRGNYLDTLVSEFISMLKDEINNRRVVYYSGCTAEYSSCHAYVLDGYDANDLFHLNYGWGGASNGFYAIDNFVAGPMHFDYGSETVTNIFPSGAVANPSCSGHKRNTASFGYIADGSKTTKPYQPNPDCSWMIAAPDAYSYSFKFDRLDISEGDFVTIYNGPTEQSGIKVQLSGSELPNATYNVSADSVLITFKGNGNNSEHYGFLISYSASLNAPTCNGVTQVADIWNTTLSDGSEDGKNYRASSNCTWNVTHNYISGYAFTFDKFNLGYGDFVDIYDMTTTPATLHKRFDIYNMPEGIYNVPFKKMRVNFVSDNWDQGEGFRLTYYALASIEDYCGIEDVTVYPNPASDKVNIKFSTTDSEIITLKITDLTGKVMLQVKEACNDGENNTSLNVSGLARGMYLLEISNQKGKTVRKISVQ